MKRVVKKILQAIYTSFPYNPIRLFAFRKDGNKIGEKVYLGPNLTVISEKSKNVFITIGDRVSIAPNVTMILVSGANNSILSTYISWKAEPIILEDDCWIGTGVIIYPGVRIGKCSVVSAGSVVTKDVEEYTIVGGVPAKFIKKITF